MEWKGNLALDENKKNSHNLNSLIFQTPPYQPTNGFKAEKKKIGEAWHWLLRSKFHFSTLKMSY